MLNKSLFRIKDSPPKLGFIRIYHCLGACQVDGGGVSNTCYVNLPIGSTKDVFLTFLLKKRGFSHFIITTQVIEKKYGEIPFSRSFSVEPTQHMFVFEKS